MLNQAFEKFYGLSNTAKISADKVLMMKLKQIQRALAQEQELATLSNDYSGKSSTMRSPSGKSWPDKSGDESGREESRSQSQSRNRKFTRTMTTAIEMHHGLHTVRIRSASNRDGDGGGVGGDGNECDGDGETNTNLTPQRDDMIEDEIDLNLTNFQDGIEKDYEKTSNVINTNSKMALFDEYTHSKDNDQNKGGSSSNGDTPGDTGCDTDSDAGSHDVPFLIKYATNTLDESANDDASIDTDIDINSGNNSTGNGDNIGSTPQLSVVEELLAQSAQNK